MRKDKILAETQRHRMLETAGLNSLQGANLITVDMQPEYENYFTFNINEYLQLINDNIDVTASVTFLYNGEDSLGMISEYDFKFWLVDNGLNEEILDECYFYDKGYAFLDIVWIIVLKKMILFH